MDELTVKELQQQLVAEQEAHEATKKEFSDFKLEHEAAILKERARNPKKVIPVEFEGKKYVFDRQKVRWKGEIVDAETLVENEEYIKHILSLEGQNILKADD